MSRYLGRHKIGMDLERGIALISKSGLFDPDAYLERYPDVAASGMDPLRHYVLHGAAEGRSPGSRFDVGKYAAEHPDVFISNSNPLLHYLGLQVDPIAGNTGAVSKVVLEVRDAGVFDVAGYLAAYPDVKESDIYLAAKNEEIGAISHYLMIGANKGYDPCEGFDTGFYLARYPDVANSGINPLVHYIEFGWNEFRNPSALFDTGWYWIVRQQCRGQQCPLAHYLRIGRTEVASTSPSSPILVGERRELIDACKQVLAQRSLSAEAYARIGRYAASLGLWAASEDAFRAAIEADNDVPSFHRQLIDALKHQGRRWQLIEATMAACALQPEDAQLHFQLGVAQEEMNRFEEAALAYGAAIRMYPGHSTWHYRLGYVLERMGQTEASQSVYAQAIRLGSKNGAPRYGVGVFHESRGYWREAADAYSIRLQLSPHDADLYYRQGLAFARCFEWEQALRAFENAVACSGGMGLAEWHYRIGFSMERLGRLDEAAQAYGVANDLTDVLVPDWQYRQGYVLAAAGRHREACQAYWRAGKHKGIPGGSIPFEENGSEERSSNGDGTRKFRPERSSYWARFEQEHALADSTGLTTFTPERYFRQAVRQESEGDWTSAAASYLEAVARKDIHMPDWYHRLGVTLMHAGQYKKACDAFVEMRIFRRPYLAEADVYEKNAGLAEVMHYCEYFETLAIQDKVIIYESFGGSTVSCNPYAIFSHLIDHPDYAGWRHVWAVKNVQQVPVEHAARKNVIFVVRGSDLYARYLASASHLINNATFPTWFIRRPQQRYLNTWHGTPLKTLGRDMAGRFLEHKTVTRNILHATHLISPNHHTTEVLLRKHEVDGICPAMVAETGYPRIDMTLNSSASEREALRIRLGVGPCDTVLLYAPTWRGTHGAVDFDVARLKEDLAALRSTGVHVLFRGHSLMEAVLAGQGVLDSVVPHDVDTNVLLGIVDVLVTDYSSVFFDFIPTRRKIIFYAYDLEAYRAERGLYFALEEMPGTLCRTRDELMAAVEELGAAYPKDVGKLESAANQFCPYEDGGASARAVGFFFEDCVDSVVDSGQDGTHAMLMYAGDFLNNGITTSCLNLLNGIEPDKHRAAIAVEPNYVAADPVKLERISRLPSNVQRIARVGRMLVTPDERWLIDDFNRRFHFASKRKWEPYRVAFQREFTRTFGFSRFDAIVEFEGYVRFWASTFAFGGSPDAHKSIYLHNDMVAEFNVRFPYLEGIFAMYAEYDRLISVSEMMRGVNATALGMECGLDASKFDFCNNTIDASGIVQKSKCAIDDDLREFMDGKFTYLMLGRLSVEKDHAKLIRAFAEVHRQYPETRLVIAGDGPLATELRALSLDLEVSGSVLLAGLRSNPFPLLAACDCFVLSSNHEGQPMVLLEAMVLGRPIVATDINGNRGVLAGHYGLLVDNCVEGLATGMVEARRGVVSSGVFDAKAYQLSALSMFEHVALGVDSPH